MSRSQVEYSPNIVLISGSLREDSHNTRLMRALERQFSSLSVTLTMVTLHEIPLFNEDLLSTQRVFPEGVAKLRKSLMMASGLVLVSPEYNNSISGVLKNALDWLSLGPNAPLPGLLVGLAGASTGLFGTARAQVHLRTICTALGMMIMPKHELLVSSVDGKLSKAGDCLDADLAKRIESFCKAFYDVTKEHSRKKDE